VKHDLEVDNRKLHHYLEMLRIRRFEQKVLEMFSRGVFFGTTHTYLGQEANAVGVLSHIGQDDIVFSNHRGHGHFLAYGGDMRSLFAELMGKSTGVCAGRGGSQHLHWKNFYSNGIQGGIAPVAAGIAMSEKLKKSAAVTIAFLGDGTLGEGVLYEALNMASLWQLPYSSCWRITASHRPHLLSWPSLEIYCPAFRLSIFLASSLKPAM